MLKYISYLNLFLGIIFIAILKSNGNYLDLALMVPALFFNWITLFHFIKNNLRFEKWHIYIGFLNVFFSIISTFLTFQLIIGIYSNNAIIFGPPFFLIVIKQILDFSIIFQFIIAFRANKNILNLNSI